MSEIDFKVTMAWVLQWKFPQSYTRGQPPATGEFHLSGFANAPASLSYLQDHMEEYYGYFCNRGYHNKNHYTPGLPMAKVWSEYVVPTPVLTECTKELMKEEASNIGNTGYMQNENDSAKHYVLRELAGYEDGQLARDDEGRDDGGDAFKYNSDMRAAEAPNNYYSRCLSELQFHPLLEKALLHGHITPNQLQSDFGSDMHEYCANQMNTLLTYQLLKRTIVRINLRCTLYRQATSLPEVLDSIVCAFLGEAPSALWHGASYTEMWLARVEAHESETENPTYVEGVEDENGVLLRTLPLSPALLHHRQQRIIYTRKGENYWELPRW